MEKKITSRRAIVRALIIGGLLCAAFTVWSTQYVLVVVSGPSMEPTYVDGQKLVVTRVDAASDIPENNPVCVLYDPDNNMVIKRLIGYPRDTVCLVDGDTFVNGRELKVNTNQSWDNIQFDVPQDAYLFLGDNRLHSIDSRAWDGTYVSLDHIIGYIPNSGLEVG